MLQVFIKKDNRSQNQQPKLTTYKTKIRTNLNPKLGERRKIVDLKHINNIENGKIENIKETESLVFEKTKINP